MRYRHRRYINITVDVRTGRVKVREAGYRLGEGDGEDKRAKLGFKYLRKLTDVDAYFNN